MRPAGYVEAVVNAVLVASREQQLETEADPQERDALLDPLDHRLNEPGRAQILHALGEGAHAGQHDGAGPADDTLFRRHHRLETDMLQRLLHAAKVAHAVVNDGEEEVVMVFAFSYPDYPPTSIKEKD